MNQLAQYSTKTTAELRGICIDAKAAADAMKGWNLPAELKYLDQVNDACTVLYRRHGLALVAPKR